MNNVELDYKLFKAAKSGNLTDAKDLIEKGANVCVVKPGGETPLYKAVFHDHYDLAELLLEKGADVHTSHLMDYSLLFRAIHNNNTEMVQLLLSYGADVHASDSHGHTPLLYAVQNNNQEIAKLILEKGAGVNLTSEQGTALLRVAIENNNAGIVCLLLEKGDNANAANQQDKTPLWLAICRNNKEIIDLLLKNGANIDFANKYVTTALHIAELDTKKMIIEEAILRGIEKPEPRNLTQELSIMWDEMLEIVVLQKEVIFGTTSLWDLCTEKDEKKLEYIVRREEVQNKLSEIDFTKKFTYEFGGIDLKVQFPNFGGKIGDNLKKGIHRAKAVDEASSVECRLNEHCLRKILEVADTESVNKIRFFKSTPTTYNVENLTDPNVNIRSPGV